MGAALDARASIAAMLAAEGRAVTVRRVTPGTYDATSGATGSPTTTDHTGRARFGNYRDGLVDGTLIKKGDRRVTFQPDDWTFVPSVTDRLIDGTTPYAVVAPTQVRELEGVPFGYTLQARA